MEEKSEEYYKDGHKLLKTDLLIRAAMGVLLSLCFLAISITPSAVLSILAGTFLLVQSVKINSKSNRLTILVLTYWTYDLLKYNVYDDYYQILFIGMVAMVMLWILYKKKRIKFITAYIIFLSLIMTSTLWYGIVIYLLYLYSNYLFLKEWNCSIEASTWIQYKYKINNLVDRKKWIIYILCNISILTHIAIYMKEYGQAENSGIFMIYVCVVMTLLDMEILKNANEYVEKKISIKGENIK